ncbi:MAG: ceramidase domain-containing protein [Planctomycetota bacterium]
MISIFKVDATMLEIYRERFGNPGFWAEPFNALTNGSFLIAAVFAWFLASAKDDDEKSTTVLLSLAMAIGFGSFLFHTVPNQFTMWLDIGPIALFQVFFLWLAGNQMLGWSRPASAALVIGVVGSAFALRPFTTPLNGSLFYIPVLIAMLVIGVILAKKLRRERYLLIGAAGCFAMAIIARSSDMGVPWKFGSHFLWHTINGVVIYLALRAWIIFVTDERKIIRPNAAPESLGDFAGIGTNRL